MNVVDGEIGVEGQGSNNRGLRCGVMALDIGGGVSFGVAQALGLGQGVGELGAGGVHLVQNVVGGAVHDTQHAANLVTSQRVAQGAQDGDSTSNRGLVGELGPALRGGSSQFYTVLSQQGLVTRHHRLAGGQGTQDAGTGRLNTAGKFNNHVSSVNERLSIGGVQLGYSLIVALG